MGHGDRRDPSSRGYGGTSPPGAWRRRRARRDFVGGLLRGIRGQQPRLCLPGRNGRRRGEPLLQAGQPLDNSYAFRKFPGEEPPRLPTLPPDSWESGNRTQDGNGQVTKHDLAVSFDNGRRSGPSAPAGGVVRGADGGSSRSRTPEQRPGPGKGIYDIHLTGEDGQSSTWLPAVDVWETEAE